MGKAAFEAGKKCVPALDSELMAALVPGPIGTNLDNLTAWSKGWHAANLAAPVPGLDN